MIHIDFETFSAVDLKEVGTWVYANHPSTDILCLAYAIGDNPVQLWTPHNGHDLTDLFDDIAQGHLVEAHNSFFEMNIWCAVGVRKYNFVEIPFLSWRCSAAVASSFALPRALKEVVKCLNLKHQKDMQGNRTMLVLSQPKRATLKDPSTRYNPTQHEDLFTILYEYCKGDVEAERGLVRHLGQLSDTEIKVWQLDQSINMRGVKIDIDAVKTAISIAFKSMATASDRINELTDGDVTSVFQSARILSWLKSEGVEIESTGKDILQAINLAEVSEKAREFLKLKVDFSKSSISKYDKMLAVADAEDGRIRGEYLYHGATTGRWSGRGVQLQNLPRGDIKDIDSAISTLKQGCVDEIKSKYPDAGVLSFLSSVIRGVIVAEEGFIFYQADYANIEVRGLAWLAGHDSLLQDFRAGKKIYEKQAAAVYGIKEEDVAKDSVERLIGKELVIACGYGMGHETFHHRCKLKGVELSLDFCKLAIATYRDINYLIPQLWTAQERAVILAIETGKPIRAGKVVWYTTGDFLFCELPSGRELAYFKPSIKEVETPWGSKRSQAFVWGEKNSSLQEFSLYGGKIVENLVQAICRDITAEAMLRLDNAGYKIVMHSHDEIVAEVEEDFGSLEEYIQILCEVPRWAEGLPVQAEGWAGFRYKK